MSPRLARYIAAGRTLSPQEREIAALALQHVDDDEQGSIDTAWEDEIDRRVTEVLSGEVELVDGEETFAEAEAWLTDRKA